MKDFPPDPLKGMKIRRNPKNRYTVVSCYFYADPKKDPERLVCNNPECHFWIEDLKDDGLQCPECKEGTLRCAGQRFYDKVIAPLPHLQQRVEFYIDHTAKIGKRVIAQFSETFHTGHHEVPDRALLYRGWDFGKHHPAAVVCYDNTYLDRFEVLYCFLGYEITFRVFCQQVVEWCNKFWSTCKFLEGIDPHGLRASGHGGMIEEGSDTNATYMMNVQSMDVDWKNCSATEGRDQLAEVITARSVDAAGNYPFSINKTENNILYSRDPQTKILGGTEVLIKGLSGQWRFTKKQDGTYSNEPVKNVYSHCPDALVHAILRARGERENEEADQEMLLVCNPRPVNPDNFGIGVF